MVFKVVVIGRYLVKSGGLTVCYAGFAVSGMTTGRGKLLEFDCEFKQRDQLFGRCFPYAQ